MISPEMKLPLFQLPNSSLQKCWFHTAPIPWRSVSCVHAWLLKLAAGLVRHHKQQKPTKLRTARIQRGQPRPGARTSEASAPRLRQILRLQLREGSDVLQMAGFNLPPCLCLCELHFQGKCAVSCPMRVEGCRRGTTAVTARAHTGRHCSHAAFFAGLTASCRGPDL